MQARNRRAALAQKRARLYTERFPADTWTRRKARTSPRRGGCMRRSGSRIFAVFFTFLGFAAWNGCGSSNPVGTSATPTPTGISLTPATGSLDLGATLQFVARLIPATNVPIVYSSSNPSVLTFVPTAAGLACAGRWDTLARVCTPQGAGLTQVTATANGVTSAPVTVYVHEHVDLITLSLINPPVPLPDCITLA